MKTSLVIMAAGIGSRFGKGIKQLEAVGPNGEIIMDYSIHDAIAAGFNEVVFIIRRDIQNAFHAAIGHRIEDICKAHGVRVRYAFQDPLDLPEGVSFPEGRVKPWGTGQAVLACRDILDCPFVVVNADDYYGKDAFEKIHSFLCANPAPGKVCMAGFVLRNTLSDHGGVTRGICAVDESGALTHVTETRNIVKVTDEQGVHAMANGQELDLDSLVSMNMWGLTPSFMELLAQGFGEFFRELEGDLQRLLTTEYLLPVFIDKLLKQQLVEVTVLQAKDRWFGVTYQEDKQTVIDAFRKLIQKGVYARDLFSDLPICKERLEMCP